ncbi:Fatty acid-binding protein 1 [Eumeta japonica]|uniref:Fatty acid-binding protein 1 n=1 Tax=Eumeta variegata TaxID=151549 RepID=A0A4C1VAU6_EUMVA|nr:Fatty acid-binding protein 1 [Eumeta japonica]
MADFLGKVYKYERSENDEAYLDFLGIQGDNRAAYLNAKPSVKLTKNGDNYTFDIMLGERTISNTFQPGKDFDEQMAPGVTYKSTCIVESNKLLQMQQHPSGKLITITREFSPAEMKATTTAEGWSGSATRYYKAV